MCCKYTPRLHRHYSLLYKYTSLANRFVERERRGWLGDAQLSFATVIHNIDGGAFYTKWIKDLVDTQVYDNRTMNAKGALPDCVPFYGHGGTESDPGVSLFTIICAPRTTGV